MLDSVYPFQSVFAEYSGEPILDSLLGHLAVPMSSPEYSQNSSLEKFEASLILCGKETSYWQFAQGLPFPPDLPPKYQVIIRAKLHDYTPQDLKVAVTQLLAFEKLVEDTVVEAERKKIWQDLQALTPAQKNAVIELIRLGFDETRINVIYPLMERFKDKQGNKKTLVRFLVTLSGDAFAGTGVEGLLDDTIDESRRAEIFKQLDRLNPREHARRYRLLGAAVSQQLEKIGEAITQAVVNINSACPNVLPRQVKVVFVTNAPHPVLLNRDDYSLEIDLESLLSSQPLSVVALFHDARHRTFHTDISLLLIMKDFGLGAEEIINILFDHSFLHEPAVEYLTPSLRKEFFKALQVSGAADYADLMLRMDKLDPKQRIEAVIAYLLSHPELRERFPDIKEENRETLVGQVQNLLESLSQMPVTTSAHRLFRRFAKPHVPAKAFVQGEIQHTIDWRDIAEKLRAHSSYEEVNAALSTALFFAKTDSDWVPSAEMAMDIVNLVDSKFDVVRTKASKILALAMERKGFPLMPQQVFERFLTMAASALDRVKSPQDRSGIFESRQNAVIASALIKGTLVWKEKYPEIAALPAVQTKIDEIALKLTETFVDLQKEKEAESPRVSALAPMEIQFIGKTLLDGYELLMSSVSAGAKPGILNSMSAAYFPLLKEATDIYEALSKQTAIARKLGIMEWTAHFHGHVQLIARLGRLDPSFIADPGRAEILSKLYARCMGCAKSILIDIIKRESLYDVHSYEDLMAATFNLLSLSDEMLSLDKKDLDADSKIRIKEISLLLVQCIETLRWGLIEPEGMELRGAFGFVSLMHAMKHTFASYELLLAREPSIMDDAAKRKLSELNAMTISAQAAYSAAVKVSPSAEEAKRMGMIVQQHSMEELGEFQNEGKELFEMYRNIYPDFLQTGRRKDSYFDHLAFMVGSIPNLTRAVKSDKEVFQADSLRGYAAFLRSYTEWIGELLDLLMEKSDEGRMLPAMMSEDQKISCDMIKRGLPKAPDHLCGLVSDLLDNLKGDRGVVQKRGPLDVSGAIYELCGVGDQLLAMTQEYGMTSDQTPKKTAALMERVLQESLSWFQDGLKQGPLSQQYGQELVFTVAFNLQATARDYAGHFSPHGPSLQTVLLHREFARYPQYTLGKASQDFVEKFVSGLEAKAPLEYAQGSRDLAKTVHVQSFVKSQRDLIAQAGDSLMPEKGSLVAALESIREQHPMLYELYVSKPRWKIDVVEGYYRPLELRDNHQLVIDRRLLADPDLLAFLLVAEWMKDLAHLNPLEQEVLGMKVLGTFWDDMTFDRISMSEKMKSQFANGQAFAQFLEDVRKAKVEKRDAKIKDFLQEAAPRLKYESFDSSALARVARMSEVLLGKWSGPEQEFQDELRHEVEGVARVQLLRVIGDEFWVIQRDKEGSVEEIRVLSPGSQHTWNIDENPVTKTVPALEVPLTRVLRPILEADEKQEEAHTAFAAFIRTWIIEETSALGVRSGKIPNPGELEQMIHKTWKTKADAAIPKAALEEEANARHRILAILLYLNDASRHDATHQYLFAKALELLKSRSPELRDKKLADLKWKDLEAAGARKLWSEYFIDLANELLDHDMLWERMKRRWQMADASSKKPGVTMDTILKEISAEKARLNERFCDKTGKRKEVKIFKGVNTSLMPVYFKEHRVGPIAQEILQDIGLARKISREKVVKFLDEHIQSQLARIDAAQHGNFLVGLTDAHFQNVMYRENGLQLSLLEAISYAGTHWSDIILKKYRKKVVGKYSIGHERKMAKWMFGANIPGKWNYRNYGHFEEEIYDAIQAFTEIATDYSFRDQAKHARQSRVDEARKIPKALRQEQGKFVFHDGLFALMEETGYIPGLLGVLQKASVTAADINEKLFDIEKVDYKSKDYRRKLLLRIVEDLRSKGRIETVLDLIPSDLPKELSEESGLGFPQLVMEVYADVPLPTLGIHDYPEIETLQPFLIHVPERWQDTDNRVGAMDFFYKRFGDGMLSWDQKGLLGNAPPDFDMEAFVKSVQKNYSPAAIQRRLEEIHPPTEKGFIVESVAKVVQKVARVQPHHLAFMEAGLVTEGNFETFKKDYNKLAEPGKEISLQNDELKVILGFMDEVRKHRQWLEFQRLIHVASHRRFTPEEKTSSLRRAVDELSDQILIRRKIRERATEIAQKSIEFSRLHREGAGTLRIKMPNHFGGSIMFANRGDTIQIIQENKEPLAFLNDKGEWVHEFPVVTAEYNYIEVSLEGFKDAAQVLKPFEDQTQRGIIRVQEVDVQRGELIENQVLELVRNNLYAHRQSLPPEHGVPVGGLIDQILRVDSLPPVELKESYEKARAMFDELMNVGKLGKHAYKDLKIFKDLRKDPSQMAAVLLGLFPNMPMLYHGPPGTGKTHVITALLLLHMAKAQKDGRELSILVASQANIAVDNVLKNLIDIYHKAGLSNAKMPFRRIAASPEKMDKGISPYFWMPPAEKEMLKFKKENPRNIVFATNVGSKTNVACRKQVFDLIFLDETTKADPAQILAPFISMGWDEDKGKIMEVTAATIGNWFMFGDHKQLPPFPLDKQSIEAAGLTEEEAEALSASTFENLMESGRDQVLLSRNYRSRPPIAMLVSRLFYDGAIVPRSWEKDRDGRAIVHEKTFQLIDTSREDYIPICPDPEFANDLRHAQRHEKPEGTSYYNNLEALLVIDRIYSIMKRGRSIKDILVIPPYQPQLDLIQRLLIHKYFPLWYKTDPQIKALLETTEEFNDARKQWLVAGGQDLQQFRVDEEFFESLADKVVKTTDASQGLQNKIVILPFARSNERGSIGFLNDLHRLNVGLSRAEDELVIIGDGETLLNASLTFQDMRARKKFEAIWGYEKEFTDMLAQYKIGVLSSVAQACAAAHSDREERIKLFLEKYGDTDSKIYGLVSRMKQTMDAGKNLDVGVMRSLAREQRIWEASLDMFMAFWLLHPEDALKLIKVAIDSKAPLILEAALGVLKTLPQDHRTKLGVDLIKDSNLEKASLGIALLQTTKDPSVVPALLQIAERSPPLVKKIRLVLNHIPTSGATFPISRNLYDKMRFTNLEPVHGSGILLKGGLLLIVNEKEPPQPLVEPFRALYPRLIRQHEQFLKNLLSKDRATVEAIAHVLMGDTKRWEKMRHEFQTINPIAEDLRLAGDADWALRMTAFYLALRRVVKAETLLNVRGQHAQRIGRFMEMMEKITESKKIIVKDSELPFRCYLHPDAVLSINLQKDLNTQGERVVGRLECFDSKTGQTRVVSFDPPNLLSHGKDYDITVELQEDGRSVQLSRTLSGILNPVFRKLDLEISQTQVQARTGQFAIAQLIEPSEAQGISNILQWLEDTPTTLSPFQASVSGGRVSLGSVGGFAASLPIPVDASKVWVIPEEDSDYGVILRIYDQARYDAKQRGKVFAPVAEFGRKPKRDGGLTLFNVGEQAFTDFYYKGRPKPRKEFYPEVYVTQGHVQIGNARLPVPLPTGAKVVLVTRPSGQGENLDLLVFEKEKYAQEFSQVAARKKGLSQLSLPVAIYRNPGKKTQWVSLDPKKYFVKPSRPAFVVPKPIRGREKTLADMDIYPTGPETEIVNNIRIYDRAIQFDALTKLLIGHLRQLNQIVPGFLPKKLAVRFKRNLPHPILFNSDDAVIEVDVESLESEDDLMMLLALHHDINHFKINVQDKVVEEVLAIRADLNFIWQWEMVAEKTTGPGLRQELMEELTEAGGEDYAKLLRELEGESLQKQADLILNFIHDQAYLHKRLGYDPAKPLRSKRLAQIQEITRAQAPILDAQNFTALPPGVFQMGTGYYETLQYPFQYWNRASWTIGTDIRVRSWNEASWNIRANIRLVRDLASGNIMILKIMSKQETALYGKLNSLHWIRPIVAGGRGQQSIVQMPFVGDPMRMGKEDPYELMNHFQSLKSADKWTSWRKIVDAVRYLHQEASLAYGQSFEHHIRFNKDGEPVLFDLKNATPLKTHEQALRDLYYLARVFKEIFPELYFDTWDNPSYERQINRAKLLAGDRRELIDLFATDVEEIFVHKAQPRSEIVEDNLIMLFGSEFDAAVTRQKEADKDKDGYVSMYCAMDLSGRWLEIEPRREDFSDASKTGFARNDLLTVKIDVKANSKM